MSYWQPCGECKNCDIFYWEGDCTKTCETYLALKPDKRCNKTQNGRLLKGYCPAACKKIICKSGQPTLNPIGLPISVSNVGNVGGYYSYYGYKNTMVNPLINQHTYQLLDQLQNQHVCQLANRLTNHFTNQLANQLRSQLACQHPMSILYYNLHMPLLKYTIHTTINMNSIHTTITTNKWNQIVSNQIISNGTNIFCCYHIQGKWIRIMNNNTYHLK